MAGRERRISPRRNCVVLLRFRVIANGADPQTGATAAGDRTRALKVTASSATAEGEVLNLSERGLYFTSPEKLSVGAPLEMYLTLPRELTGRGPEPVRCKARVVHVEECAGQRGLKGIGAAVERFEPLAAPHDWSN
jgi:hypothetical protein